MYNGAPIALWPFSLLFSARHMFDFKCLQTRMLFWLLGSSFFPPSCAWSLAMTEPRKRPRRNTLQAASIGSLDIRDALLRGSQVPSTPSDVTNDQEAALVEWGREPLKIAMAAWKDCPNDASPLLLAANLALIPATVLHAFGMMEQDLAAQPELIDVERIKACIERAAAWMSSQERLYIDIAAWSGFFISVCFCSLRRSSARWKRPMLRTVSDMCCATLASDCQIPEADGSPIGFCRCKKNNPRFFMVFGGSVPLHDTTETQDAKCSLFEHGLRFIPHPSLHR